MTSGLGLMKKMVSRPLRHMFHFCGGLQGLSIFANVSTRTRTISCSIAGAGNDHVTRDDAQGLEALKGLGKDESTKAWRTRQLFPTRNLE